MKLDRILRAYSMSQKKKTYSVTRHHQCISSRSLLSLLIQIIDVAPFQRSVATSGYSNQFEIKSIWLHSVQNPQPKTSGRQAAKFIKLNIFSPEVGTDIKLQQTAVTLDIISVPNHYLLPKIITILVGPITSDIQCTPQ